MHIDHKPGDPGQSQGDLFQEMEEFLPCPADDRDVGTYLPLPDVHHRLLDVLQTRRLDVERGDDIKIGLAAALALDLRKDRDLGEDIIYV